MLQRKSWDKEKIINEVLQPMFKLGCSVRKACAYAGIPSTTVQTWIENDDSLRAKITSWQNEPNLLARKQWIKNIKEGKPTKFGADDYTPSKEWLERTEKDEFSTRQENINTERSIQEIIDEFQDPDNLEYADDNEEKTYKPLPDTNEGGEEKVLSA